MVNVGQRDESGGGQVAQALLIAVVLRLGHMQQGGELAALGAALDGVEAARYFAGLQTDELIDILCEA